MSFMQNKGIYSSLIIIIVSFLVFYTSFVIQVWQPINPHWVSDVPNHAQFISEFTQKGHFPIYSIWYVFVALFSGFSSQLTTIAYVSIALLSALIGIKYLISYMILKTDCEDTNKTAFLALTLIFVMPILSFYTASQYPNQFIVNQFHVYLGNIAANQWHNSTLILAMPFNLLLFYYSVRYINSERLYHFLIMGIYAVLSILCKPNYALAFIPVLCLTLFVLNIQKHHYLNAFIKPLIIAAPAILALFYQWYFTFVDNDLFKHPTKTVIAPFLVWRYYSPNLFISLLLSIAFPLMIAFFYFKKIDRYLVLSWFTFLVALMIFSFFAEQPIFASANYAWGSIAATYILFLFSIKIVLNQPLDWKAKIAYTILGLHVISGYFLLGIFFIKQTPLIL